MKKSNEKVQLSQFNSSVVAGNAAPKQGAPTPPADFTPKPRKRGTKLPLHRAQVGCVGPLTAELSAAANPQADFGPHIPNFAMVVALLGLAGGWSSERARAEAWRAYVSEQEASAWTPVAALLDMYSKAFKVAAARDPSVLERYPASALYFSLRSRRTSKRKAKAPAAPQPSNGAAQPAAPASNGSNNVP